MLEATYPCLDSENGGSCGEVRGIIDVARSSQVCRDTDTFEYAGEGDELVDIRDTFDIVSTCLARYDDEGQLPEVVCASCDGTGASCSKGGRQEANVSGLVVGEGLDLTIEGCVVTC